MSQSSSPSSHDEEIDRIIARTMMSVIQTAANDGIISEEEKEMIDTFEFSLGKYKQALQEAYADGVITKEEEEKLVKLKDVIIGGGRIVADSIDGISKDEMNLLIAVMLSLDTPNSQI